MQLHIIVAIIIKTKLLLTTLAFIIAGHTHKKGKIPMLIIFK